MNKQVFMFPGQGAQYVGMGQDLAKKYPVARETFEEADEALGFKLSDFIFNGTSESLKQTEITQPAIVATSIATLRVLQEREIFPEAVAGLSLGEYSALVAADVLSFEDAILLVQKRGKYMQDSVPPGEGLMAAILGLDREKVLEICRQSSEPGVVEPVNYNCPGQIVIAGNKVAVKKTCARLREAGARRAIELAVSVPFHCRLLRPVEQKMAQELNNIDLRSPEVSFVANYNASYLHETEEIKEALVKQVSNPVLWEDSMELLLDDGYNRFIEVGPGKVLTGFMKKISPGAWAAQVGSEASLSKIAGHF